jgi:hypothetical protein
VWLHIPLTLMLIGIVFRGSAFVFRYYDVKGDPFQRRWGRIFAMSSIASPFFLGVSLGAVTSGRLEVDVSAGGDFVSTFVLPWLHPFPMLVGRHHASQCGSTRCDAATALDRACPRRPGSLPRDVLALPSLQAASRVRSTGGRGQCVIWRQTLLDSSSSATAPSGRCCSWCSLDLIMAAGKGLYGYFSDSLGMVSDGFHSADEADIARNAGLTEPGR